ncbi:hypothetical protein Tco_0469465 [Tanacetum coccineum]
MVVAVADHEDIGGLQDSLAKVWSDYERQRTGNYSMRPLSALSVVVPRSALRTETSASKDLFSLHNFLYQSRWLADCLLSLGEPVVVVFPAVVVVVSLGALVEAVLFLTFFFWTPDIDSTMPELEERGARSILLCLYEFEKVVFYAFKSESNI